MKEKTCCKHKYSLLTLVVVGLVGYVWGRRVGLEEQNFIDRA